MSDGVPITGHPYVEYAALPACTLPMHVLARLMAFIDRMHQNTSNFGSRNLRVLAVFLPTLAMSWYSKAQRIHISRKCQERH